MAQPAVIIGGADKGGVGKTVIARTLLDYFFAHQVPARTFDTEASRGTLKRFHPDVTEVVDMTSIPDQMRIFDTLSSSDSAVTVIDVGAGLMSSTLKALRDIGFIEAAKKGRSPSPCSISSDPPLPRSTRSMRPPPISATRDISW
jgi:hypothetical protein